MEFICYLSHMPIPISALQRNAAAAVRRVAASGIAEEITDRGRVVAVLAPPPTAGGLERLRAAGAVRPADPGGLGEVLDALDEIKVPGLMKALREQRESER